MLALLPASALADETTRIIVKREPGLSAAERADIRADADVRSSRRCRSRAPRSSTAQAGRRQRRRPRPERRSRRRLRAARPARRALRTDPFSAGPLGIRKHAAEHAYFGQGTLDADMDVIEAWTAPAPAPGRAGGRHRHRRRPRRIPTSRARSVARLGLRRRRRRERRPADPDGSRHARGGNDRGGAKNGEGIAGVAPGRALVPLRTFDATGDWTSRHRRGLRLGRRRKACASSTPASPARARSDFEREAMAGHPETLFIVAAGNNGADNDAARRRRTLRVRPPNMICVGASDSNDALAEFFDGRPGRRLELRSTCSLSATRSRHRSNAARRRYVCWKQRHVDGQRRTSPASPRSCSPATRRSAPPSEQGGHAQPRRPKPALAGKSVTGRRVDANGQRSALQTRRRAASTSDGDGVEDGADNCLDIRNPGQVDGNGDDVRRP